MNKEFKSFIVENILNVEQTKSITAKSNLIEGNIPYVTRTVVDNGYMGTCGNLDKINKGNCITIGAETGVAFYQPIDFVAGNKVYRLSADGLNEKHYLFLASTLNRLTKNYSYSNARIPEKIKKEQILLPVKTDKNNNPIIDDTHFYHNEGFIPDFEYMEKYISELEKERISELEKYLTVTGLNDYELTEEDKYILSLQNQHLTKNKIDTSNWKEFSLENNSLFLIKRGKRLKSIDRQKGSVPYYSASSKNNGLTDMISNPLFTEKNSIIFSTFGDAYYVEEEFTASDEISIFQHEKLNKYNALFICSVLMTLKTLFQFGNKAFYENFKDKKIKLPAVYNSKSQKYEPDWEYMEKYIKAIEKLAIKDVVLFKDKVIKETKNIVLEEDNDN